MSETNKKKADFYCRMILSSYEASLIRQIRRIKFGDVDVKIQHGEPRRAVVKESIVLTEEDGARANLEGKEFERDADDYINILDEIDLKK